MSATTVNPEEVEKFSELAEQWWSPTGQFKPLHKINPIRLRYIREKMLAQFDADPLARAPFEGLSILDVGCGGGLLCEPLARLGAKITGIDASERNIKIAQAHAETSNLNVDYRAITAEELAQSGQQFDVVLNMEVVEHVDNVPLFLKSCADLTKEDGLMFVASINRTARAFALAIVGAEYILNWLPKGTHSYSKFLTPEEIASMLKRLNMRTIDRCGVTFMPLRNEWRQSKDLNVNYMMVAQKT